LVINSSFEEGKVDKSPFEGDTKVTKSPFEGGRGM